MIAESVNLLALTRDAWRDVAVRVGVAAEIEIVCSDPAERKRRASQRTVESPACPCPPGRTSPTAYTNRGIGTTM
ncbi:hypothetical protein [Streptomyces malaysiensis]|uniref:hypothetical protein n=1 Tax=Streptomyces malaysiensis TaxID=92644 RepID=UPI003444BB96